MKFENSYEGKLRFAKALIKLAIERTNNPCVACSFGKGSEVVLHLALQVKPDIFVMFCNTGVEYPETLKLRNRLVDEWELNYVETRYYKKNFWQCIDEYGVPRFKSDEGKSFPKCCYYLKEKPAELKYKELSVDCTLLGMQSSESRNRTMLLEYGLRGMLGRGTYRILPIGAFYWRKSRVPQFRVNPIAYWSDNDVWKYLGDNELPYNERYDMGSKRTGCWPCTAYIGWKKHLARTNMKFLKIILKKQGQTQLPPECFPS